MFLLHPTLKKTDHKHILNENYFGPFLIDPHTFLSYKTWSFIIQLLMTGISPLDGIDKSQNCNVSICNVCDCILFDWMIEYPLSLHSDWLIKILAPSGQTN